MKTKKSILTLLFVIVGVVASAQIRFGAKAGVNLASQRAKASNITLTGSSKIGPLVGGFLEYDINDNFTLQPELLYSSLGDKFSVGNVSGTDNVNYVNIPLLFKYKLSNFNIGLGPQLGFLISAKTKVQGETDDTMDSYRGTDFSLIANAGYDFSDRIVAGIRYQEGISNIDKDFSGQATVRNRAFSLTIGYRFN